MVKVLIFGQTLREVIEEPEFEFEVHERMTVRALLESRMELLQPLQPLLNSSQIMITVNQKVSTLETQVNDGDTIKLTHQSHPEHEGMFWHNP